MNVALALMFGPIGLGAPTTAVTPASPDPLAPVETRVERDLKGKVFTFCCHSCECSFLSKDTPEELSTFLTHQLEDANPLFSWLQEAALHGASDLFISVGESPTMRSNPSQSMCLPFCSHSPTQN